MAIGDPVAAVGPNIDGGRLMGSPVSVIVQDDAPQATPSTGPPSILSSTPDAPISAVPVSFSPPWVNDPQRYKVMITPPAPIAPEQLVTPEIEPVYTHDPKIAPKFVPHPDMSFASLEDAFKFYCAYAMLAGFPVKKNRMRYNKTGQDFECSFEGKHAGTPGGDRKRGKTSKRKGCKAMVCAKQSKEAGCFFFQKISLEHNHILTHSPKMVKRMRSHKEKDPAFGAMVDMLLNSNVKHVHVMNVLNRTVGGNDNLNITERDIQNRRAALAREEVTDDIPKLKKFFEECKKNNPQFYYSFQVDSKNVVRNVFWSHASQQADYQDFGDVVTFDTTYRTNLYSMPLAMFVGFNHQLQNVVFAQALIRDEKTEAFEWVFEQFRICMGGKDPITIFTDQDTAIGNAIHSLFPKTYHRFCRWHIVRKYRDPLNQLYTQHKDLCATLTSVINNPLNPAEFERAWAEMKKKFELEGRLAIEKLYDERKMWIAAFFKEIYCGPVSSTQRSESVNATVKGGYVDNSTPIHEFAKSFLDMLVHVKENEARELYNSQSIPVQPTNYGYDDQLAKHYTRSVYNRFKQTFHSSTSFKIRPDVDKPGYFFLKHRKVNDPFPWIQHEFWVKAVVDNDDPEKSVFSCECMTWEHTGFFCPHLVQVFSHLCVERIPSRYILKRYTRNPHKDISFDRHDIVFMGPDGDTKLQRTAAILPGLFKIQRSAIMSAEAMEKAMQIIRDAVIALEAIPPDLSLPTSSAAQGNVDMMADHTTGATNAPPTDTPQDGGNVSATAPPISTTKGSRKRNNGDESAPEPHFKRPKEKQKRRCGRRGKVSSGHNAATCERNQQKEALGVTKRPRGRPRGSGRGRGETQGRGQGEHLDEGVHDAVNAVGHEMGTSSVRTRSATLNSGRGGGRTGSGVNIPREAGSSQWLDNEQENTMEYSDGEDDAEYEYMSDG